MCLKLYFTVLELFIFCNVVCTCRYQEESLLPCWNLIKQLSKGLEALNVHHIYSMSCVSYYQKQFILELTQHLY